MWLSNLCGEFYCSALAQQAKRFISELNRMAEQNASSLFSVQQLKDLTKVHTAIGNSSVFVLTQYRGRYSSAFVTVCSPPAEVGSPAEEFR